MKDEIVTFVVEEKLLIQELLFTLQGLSSEVFLYNEESACYQYLPPILHMKLASSEDSLDHFLSLFLETSSEVRFLLDFVAYSGGSLCLKGFCVALKFLLDTHLRGLSTKSHCFVSFYHTFCHFRTTIQLLYSFVEPYNNTKEEITEENLKSYILLNSLHEKLLECNYSPEPFSLFFFLFLSALGPYLELIDGWLGVKNCTFFDPFKEFSFSKVQDTKEEGEINYYSCFLHNFSLPCFLSSLEHLIFKSGKTIQSIKHIFSHLSRNEAFILPLQVSVGQVIGELCPKSPEKAAFECPLPATVVTPIDEEFFGEFQWHKVFDRTDPHANKHAPKLKFHAFPKIFGKGIKFAPHTPIPPVSVLLEKTVLRFVREKCEMINQSLLLLLKEKYCLYSLLQKLRLVYFFEEHPDNPFLSSTLLDFYRDLFEFANSSPIRMKMKQWNFQVLTIFQKRCPDSDLRIEFSNNFDTDIQSNNNSVDDNFILLNDSFLLKYCKTLKFFYRIPHPLNLIIEEPAIATYNQINDFLLQLFYSKWALEVFFSGSFIQMSQQKKLHHINRFSQLLRSRMLHFVNSIKDYLLSNVFFQSWKSLINNLEASTLNGGSFDELRVVHLKYLSLLFDQCYLNPKASIVSSSLMAIFNCIKNFKKKFILLQNLPNETSISSLFNDIKIIDIKFNKQVKFLVSIVDRITSQKTLPFLEDMLLRLNYNNYFISE